MAAPDPVLTFIVAGLASLFMAWSIGAGSSGSTPFAPAVGANAISIMRAGFIVGILGLAGATLQGANVTEAVGQELIQGVALSPAASTIGLLIAAGLVAIGVFTGYPIATAFTVTGAVIGVGLALGGDPAWGKYWEIGLLWLLTPVFGGGVAFAIAHLLEWEDLSTQLSVPVLGGLVGMIIANIEFSVLGAEGEALSIVETVAPVIAAGSGLGRWSVWIVISGTIAIVIALVLFFDLGRDSKNAQQRFLLVLGGLVAFSAGGSQVGLAIGPLLPLLGTIQTELPLTMVLFGGGVGMLVGSWTGAPRMIKALSQDYSSLSPQRSIAALIPSFVIAQTAVFFGIPVSFNEIVVSAIIGSGYAGGTGGVSRDKMLYTIMAWIGSFVLAFLLSYGIYLGFRTVT